MKKAILSIVLICYLALTCGVMVSYHYCMDKLASAELFSSRDSKCGKCGMHMDTAHGCCRDEVQVVKMDDDQRLTAPVDLFIPSMEMEFQTPSEFLAANFYNFAASSAVADHSPPLHIAKDFCVELSVFRI